MSPGLAAGSRPTLLSPHTTRSGRAPAGRVRLSRSLAENRSSTGPTTPGWTYATRTVPAGGGAGRSDQKASAARGRATAAAAAVARVGPGTPRPTAAATATLTATSRKLSPQTPPRAATDNSAGAFHWLAPSSPQGPPSASQERSASPATNALGTSTIAAASRLGPGRPAPPSSAQASQPSGSHSTARSMASGTMNGPTVGNRKALTARKNPVPPSQARTAASPPLGAATASSSTGTRPTRASHHHPGRGKARASGAPSSSAASRPPHLLGKARQRFMATYLVSRYSAMPSGPPSRPTPDCLTPPKGAAGFETRPWLRPTMPVSSASTTRKARLRSLV